jgi:protein-disulfide isomerase
VAAKQVKKVKKASKTKVTIMIALALVASVIAFKFFQQYFSPALEEVLNPRVKGNENAPIKIAEYIDLQCPACAQGAKILKTLMEDHPDAIRLELHYYPLSNHKHGFLSATYAECAARQGKLWMFVELILENQSKWATTMNPVSIFENYAKTAGVDLRKLDSCLEDPNVSKFIAQSKTEGDIKKVKSTPTYFINGEMMVGSRTLQATLEKLIAEKFSSSAQ